MQVSLISCGYISDRNGGAGSPSPALSSWPLAAKVVA